MILRGLQIRKVAFGDKHKRQRIIAFSPGSTYSDDNDLGAENQLASFAEILRLINEPEPVIEVVEAPDFLQYEADVPRRAMHTLYHEEEFKDGETLVIGACTFEFKSDVDQNSKTISVKLMEDNATSLKLLADAINNQHNNCKVTAEIYDDLNLLTLKSAELGLAGNTIEVTGSGFTISKAPGSNGDIRRTAKIKIQITKEMKNFGHLVVDSGLPLINDFLIQGRCDDELAACPTYHRIVDGTLLLSDFADVAVGTTLSIHCYE